MSDLRILFFGKADDELVDKAVGHLKKNFSNVEIFRGTRFDPFPLKNDGQQRDMIISYLCPWIIPQWVLDNVKGDAINFHSGSPEYPGIGCTNFAIYNEEKEYGITCHHMAPEVDTGKIVACKRFPLEAMDSVYALTRRCYENIYELFVEIVGGVAAGKPLPESEEKWARAPYKRKELNALCEITPDMDEQEIKRRIRATSFPGMPGAYVILCGEKFLAGKSVNCKAE